MEGTEDTAVAHCEITASFGEGQDLRQRKEQVWTENKESQSEKSKKYPQLR